MLRRPLSSSPAPRLDVSWILGSNRSSASPVSRASGCARRTRWRWKASRCASWTMTSSPCPVVVETSEHESPELIPYLAPVATPIAAEARYLRQMYGARTPIVYAGVCLTEGGSDVEAAVTFEDLRALLERRGVSIAEQPLHFDRLPEEWRRHWSTAGGLPLEVLMEETHASRRFRQVRGLGQLEAIARAVA